MGSKADRAAPYWFFKPTTSYLAENTGPILLPKNATVHHEVELGVVIGTAARKVTAENAHTHIAGYVCAIDVTARNWQTQAKTQGRPWSLAKGCDTFLPISSVLPREAITLSHDDDHSGGGGGIADVQLYLDVNGVRKQHGSTKNMIWRIPELIERVSEFVTLEPWDVLLTGTPSGVGEIRAGDRIRAGIEGLVEMEFHAEEDS